MAVSLNGRAATIRDINAVGSVFFKQVSSALNRSASRCPAPRRSDRFYANHSGNYAFHNFLKSLQSRDSSCLRSARSHATAPRRYKSRAARILATPRIVLLSVTNSINGKRPQADSKGAALTRGCTFMQPEGCLPSLFFSLVKG